ncbi:hypothetical protein Tco_0351219 [Tanacetum coccineum]
MHSNTSRILLLFCHEFQKLIAHLIPLISLKLLVEHASDDSSIGIIDEFLFELPSALINLKYPIFLSLMIFHSNMTGGLVARGKASIATSSS